MTPAYDRDGVTLYAGDVLAVLRELPDASIDAVITDPPYSSGGAYRGDRTANSSEYLPIAVKRLDGSLSTAQGNLFTKRPA